MKNLAFHSLLRWKMIILYRLWLHNSYIFWENVLSKLMGAKGLKSASNNFHTILPFTGNTHLPQPLASFCSKRLQNIGLLPLKFLCKLLNREQYPRSRLCDNLPSLARFLWWLLCDVTLGSSSSRSARATLISVLSDSSNGSISSSFSADQTDSLREAKASVRLSWKQTGKDCNPGRKVTWKNLRPGFLYCVQSPDLVFLRQRVNRMANWHHAIFNTT